MAGTYIGTWKQAAKRAGLSLDDYLARKDAGEKWCVGHKALHPQTAFPKDASRPDGLATVCGEFRRQRARDRYIPRPGPHRFGPPPSPARDGDREQARRRVNALARRGRIPPPSELPCVDCGHQGDDRRHEYDHHLGYGSEHHLDVQPVCTRCHAAREERRGVRAIGRLGRAARRHGLTVTDLVDRLASMKWCASCQTWKARSDFNADRSRRDGLDGRCRSCGAEHWLTLPARIGNLSADKSWNVIGAHIAALRLAKAEMNRIELRILEDRLQEQDG